MTDTERSGDAVTVAVRVRPLSASERADGCEKAVESAPTHGQIHLSASEKRFTYDMAFPQNCTQELVYDKTVRPLLEKSYFRGYNATVLAYGQTGSGKTFTMGTDAITAEQRSNKSTGIIPRAVKRVFEKVRTDKVNNCATYNIQVSFLEVYKEVVRDLLGGQSSLSKSVKNSFDSTGLPIRETSDGSVYVAGLSWVTVCTEEEMFQCLAKGTASRATASTQMNAHSSRSHAIFAIRMERSASIPSENENENEASKEDTREEADAGSFVATLRFCDLAGSERQKRTGASGNRLREGIQINKGLLALGNVISALGDPQKVAAGVHVPYRNSKLTRLLQSSLGGNSRTCMIACVSPADASLEETICTLRYANRARNIKNKAIVNVDPNAATIAELKNQIQTLQMLLLEQQTERTRASPADDVELVRRDDYDRVVDWSKQVLRHAQEIAGDAAILRCHTKKDDNDIDESALRQRAKESFASRVGPMPTIETTDTTANHRAADSDVPIGTGNDLLTFLKERERKRTTKQDRDDGDKNDAVHVDMAQSLASMSISNENELKTTTSDAQQDKGSEIRRQIVDVSRQLREQQRLLQLSEDTTGIVTNMRARCQAEIESLSQKLSDMQKLKSQVEQKLMTAETKMGANANQLKHKYAHKLKALKARIKILSARHAEQKRLLAKREAECRTAERCRNQLQRLKTQKASLQRELKQYSVTVREEKRKREKKFTSFKSKNACKIVDSRSYKQRITAKRS